MQQLSTDPRSSEPRVVILDAGDRPDVAVVELPAAVGPGTSFEFRGGRWRVLELRAGTRVVFATRSS